MSLALITGCGGGDDDDDASAGACGAEEALPGTLLEDVGKLASIAFQEREDNGTPMARVANASFFDLTDFDADAAPTIAFDLVCSAVVGDQVVRVPPAVLQSPEGATIAVGSETVELAEVAEGRMQVDDLPEIASGTVVSVSVVGREGADQFPSFETEAEASNAPTDLTSEVLPSGQIVLHWAPSEAEAVEVELWVTNAEPDFHPVRCVVLDDGCLTVTSEAATHLFLGVEPIPLDIRVSSVRSAQWDGPDGEVGFFKIERRRDVAYAP
jgi:hypothetical protein